MHRKLAKYNLKNLENSFRPIRYFKCCSLNLLDTSFRTIRRFEELFANFVICMIVSFIDDEKFDWFSIF